MISIKQIHYALAVEQTRHFKKAAEACSVSQSALSSAISELENQLGAQIFERDNKRVLVTPLGEEFLTRARTIAIQIEDLQALAARQKDPLSFPLSMGVIPTVGPYLLPQVLRRVREDYPDLQLSIVEEQTATLIEQVKNGQLDTAVIALPYELEGLLAFEFWQENFFLVVHKDDAEAAASKICARELDESRLLLLRDGHCLADHALAVCGRDRNHGKLSFSGSSLYTLLQMVAGHMGNTLVPEMALQQLLAVDDNLRAVPLDEPGPHRRIALICRPNFVGLPSLELLRELFHAQLSSK